MAEFVMLDPGVSRWIIKINGKLLFLQLFTYLSWLRVQKRP